MLVATRDFRDRIDGSVIQRGITHVLPGADIARRFPQYFEKSSR